MRTARASVLAAVLLAACHGESSMPDAGDARVPQLDAGRTRDAGREDAAAPEDAGRPPPGWAPQAWEDCEGGGRELTAGPSDYRSVLDTLMPGDVLRLEPGSYDRGLPLRVSGEPGRCIVIEALDPADRPVILGSDAFNLVAVHGASWIKVRHLDLDGMGLAGFGVASQGGTDMPTHHVVIEDLHMVGFGADQQIVGISTKSPAWDWVIRGNTIEGAGTGLYLGNSDGTQPFVRGVVELNTVLDPRGYCMQIKHQIDRSGVPGIPSDAETIIRWNVFAKVNGSSTGGDARPSLLLGHFPLSGPGASDRYLVYGNFFYDNPTEVLLQAEGNVAAYANVFLNPRGSAIVVQPHNDVPRAIDLFFNTVVAEGTGIRVSGGDASFAQRVRYNAVFAGTPIAASDALGDVTGSRAEASSIFVDAASPPGAGLDLHPRAGMLEASVDRGQLPPVLHALLDFDEREHGAHAGAYAGPASGAPVPLALSARTP